MTVQVIKLLGVRSSRIRPTPSRRIIDLGVCRAILQLLVMLRVMWPIDLVKVSTLLPSLAVWHLQRLWSSWRVALDWQPRLILRRSNWIIMMVSMAWHTPPLIYCRRCSTQTMAHGKHFLRCAIPSMCSMLYLTPNCNTEYKVRTHCMISNVLGRPLVAWLRGFLISKPDAVFSNPIDIKKRI